MRLTFGLVFAILVNLGLFTMMQVMTASNNVDRNDAEDIRLLDFVRVKKDTTVETKKRELPDKPKPPEKMPPPPQMTQPTKQVKTPTPKFTAPNIKVPLNIAGGPYLGEFSAAPIAPPVVSEYAQVVPLVRIPPRYPRTAARRNIEGVVKVAFTITKEGRVVNPQILSASPEGVFDKAAISAIKKWKFNPKIVDGQAVEQTAAQEITFKLSK